MHQPTYSWQPSPHTADLAIAIAATDHDGLFRAALDGLLGSIELDPAQPDEHEISEYGLNLKSYEIEAALVDFLNECIYLMEVEDLVPFRIHSISYDGDSLRSVIHCRPVRKSERNEIGHIKAATYSDLKVEKTDSEYRTRIIFDT